MKTLGRIIFSAILLASLSQPFTIVFAANSDEYGATDHYREKARNGTFYVKDIYDLLRDLGDGHVLVRLTNAEVPFDEFVTNCLPGMNIIPGHFVCQRNARKTPPTPETGAEEGVELPSYEPTPFDAAWEAEPNASPPNPLAQNKLFAHA